MRGRKSPHLGFCFSTPLRGSTLRELWAILEDYLFLAEVRARVSCQKPRSLVSLSAKQDHATSEPNLHEQDWQRAYEGLAQDKKYVESCKVQPHEKSF